MLNYRRMFTLYREFIGIYRDGRNILNKWEKAENNVDHRIIHQLSKVELDLILNELSIKDQLLFVFFLMKSFI